jgi:hypothetical protein
MPDGAGTPVMLSGVGSGEETPTDPERAAKADMTLRIGAPQSRQEVKACSVMGWR